MKTKNTPKMPFDKKVFRMTAESSSCCSSFMAEMGKFVSCCGMAEMMDEAGCDCDTSPDQKESDSEAKEESEDS